MLMSSKARWSQCNSLQQMHLLFLSPPEPLPRFHLLGVVVSHPLTQTWGEGPSWLLTSLGGITVGTAALLGGDALSTGSNQELLGTRSAGGPRDPWRLPVLHLLNRECSL